MLNGRLLNENCLIGTRIRRAPHGVTCGQTVSSLFTQAHRHRNTTQTARRAHGDLRTDLSHQSLVTGGEKKSPGVILIINGLTICKCRLVLHNLCVTNRYSSGVRRTCLRKACFAIFDSLSIRFFRSSRTWQPLAVQQTTAHNS